jgi:hypothetical protein
MPAPAPAATAAVEAPQQAAQSRPLPQPAPVAVPVPPPSSQPAAPPRVAIPAAPPVQETAQAFARVDPPEGPAPKQAAPEPPAPIPAERAPTPNNPSKPERPIAASREAASDRPAQTGSSEKLVNVKAPANASLDCVPSELRKVVADVAARFGPVTVLSTHRLNTVNHAMGSVRHKLHTACRAVDFRVEGSAAKVTAYLRSRSELAGVESYRDGVIHIDASERIKGVAVRPRAEPASARAN